MQYAPAPPRPEAFPAAVDTRRLDEKPKGAEWTGADLLAAAIARNPQIAEARAKYLTARAAARAARSPPGPGLTLTAEYANEAPHWGYAGAGDIPLDYGARRGVRITTAELQALQAFYDYGETVWSVRTDLEKARIDLGSARGEMVLAILSAAVRGERAQRAADRVKAGQDARAIALTAQADAVAANRRVAAASGRRDAATAGLAKALGVSPQAARDLGLAPVAEAPALAGLAAWRRDAAISRRDVLKAVADYDLAEQALRLEIANQYPAVSLGPGYNYDHGGDQAAVQPVAGLAALGPEQARHRPGRGQAGRGRALTGAGPGPTPWPPWTPRRRRWRPPRTTCAATATTTCRWRSALTRARRRR